MLTIEQVRREDQAAAVRALVAEFLAWLAERYPADADLIAAYFRHQRLDDQMANLLTLFCPPKAECLLAVLDGKPVGTVMMKPAAAPDTCEMNRMFVSAAGRGHGVGFALGQRLLQEARALGYRRMILSAGKAHHEAIPLYRKLGFVPDDTLPDTGAGDFEVRMALTL